MISFIVCTFNREQYIGKCLEHLKNQNTTSSYEIVLVNNNSTDNTDEICTDFIRQNPELNITYFNEKSPGLSHARNAGIRLSNGFLLCFIDDDGFVHPDYISNLERQNEDYKGLKAFGGRINPYYETEKPVWMSKWLLPLVSVLDLGPTAKAFRGSKYPVGANMGVSRAIFEEVGIFDVNLGRTGKKLIGGEEKDLFGRIKKKNISIIYLPDVRIDHVIPENRLTKDFIRRLAMGIGQSKRLYSKSSFKKIMFESGVEIIKWGGTLVLSIYLFFSHPKKSQMLIKFRFWVTKGFLTKQ